MDALLRAAVEGLDDIVPKVTKTTTEEETTFVQLDEDKDNTNGKRKGKDGSESKAKKAKLDSEAKKEEEEEETKETSEKVEQEGTQEQGDVNDFLVSLTIRLTKTSPIIDLLASPHAGKQLRLESELWRATLRST